MSRSEGPAFSLQFGAGKNFPVVQEEARYSPFSSTTYVE